VRTFIILLSILFTNNLAFANHIVGGVAEYEHISGNTYKIRFVIYRDCSNPGSPGFDGENTGAGSSPFYFAILPDGQSSAANSDMHIISFKSANKSTIPLPTDNPCLDPTSVGNTTCIDQAFYDTIITLPSGNIGYTIVYQRCCRNAGILNIQNISGTTTKPGFTIMARIPPTNTLPNSSPKFTTLPPQFICLNKQLYFNYTATDIDNDSLVYSIVTPLGGHDNNNPSTSIPGNPISLGSASPVNWQPPYNISDAMGGTPVLTINPKTGVMTCKPNSLGRFVVSICVKEYRNGVFLDSIVRDYQFNVIDCNTPNASMDILPGTYDPITKTAIYNNKCNEQSVTFSHTSTGQSSVTWDFGDPSSGTNNTSSLDNPTHFFTDSGTYLVKLLANIKTSSGAICADTFKVKVRIYPKLVSNFAMIGSPGYCNNSAIQFNTSSTTTYGSITNWLWDFGDGTTSTNQNQSHAYTSGLPSYNVKLTVTNDKGCIDDTMMTVTIDPKPTIGYSVPNPCDGELASLKSNITAGSSSIALVKWTLPNGTISTNTNETYLFTLSGPKTVKLYAKTNKGCEDSVSFNVTVFSKPTIDAGADAIICKNTSATLNATGGVSYVWTPTGFLNNPNIQNPLATIPSNVDTKFYVKGTDGNGCSNTDSVMVIFRPTPSVNAGNDTFICLEPTSPKYNTKVQLNATGNCSSYIWSPNANINNNTIANPIVSPTVTTKYSVIGSDASGCSAYDTVEIAVYDPNVNLIQSTDTTFCKGLSIFVNPLNIGSTTSYSWSPTNYISNPFVRNPLFTPIDTITYTLSASNFCFTKIDTIRMNVVQSPDALMPDLDSICYGEYYTWNLPTIYSYSWQKNSFLINTNSFNPKANPYITTTFYVTVTDPKTNCLGYDSTMIKVNYPPNVTVLTNRAYYCMGDTAKIELATSKSVKTVWYPNIRIKDTTINNTEIYCFDSTIYYVSVYSNDRCKTTKVIPINVQKPIITNVLSPVDVCIGGSRFLKAEGGLYYKWYPNYYISDTAIANPQVTPKTDFTYHVDIYNDCYHDTADVFVKLDTLPRIYIGSDTFIYRGESINLNAQTNATKVEWFPKNSIISPYSHSISVSPLSSTTYTAKATDNNGCIAMDTIKISVIGKTYLLIPTGFSPNGDGLNDIFKISKYLNIKKLISFQVFNRWGQNVFETKNIEEGWDGTISGEKAQEDAYIWSIKVLTYDNEEIIKSGAVTLIH
jgi:gliding motility-associated-like protein